MVRSEPIDERPAVGAGVHVRLEATLVVDDRSKSSTVAASCLAESWSIMRSPR